MASGILAGTNPRQGRARSARRLRLGIALIITSPNVSGKALRELMRRFTTDHRNPLGLVYSLYRGLDSYVAWPPDWRVTHARDSAPLEGRV